MCVVYQIIHVVSIITYLMHINLYSLFFIIGSNSDDQTSVKIGIGLGVGVPLVLVICALLCALGCMIKCIMNDKRKMATENQQNERNQLININNNDEPEVQ